VSNTRRAKPPRRPPDEVEAAFKAALAEGCPHCHSRKVTGKFHDGVWDYRLSCVPSCRTFAEPQLAHRLAAEAAKRAGLAIGQPLSYRAFDSGAGQVEGAVVTRGRSGGRSR
jgi:hypothetical protein